MKPEKTLLEQLRGPKVIDMARGTERSASDLELRAANEIERLETALSDSPGWIECIDRMPSEADYVPTGRIVAMNSAGYATCITGISVNTFYAGRLDGWDETPEDSTVPITDIVRWTARKLRRQGIQPRARISAGWAHDPNAFRFARDAR